MRRRGQSWASLHGVFRLQALPLIHVPKVKASGLQRQALCGHEGTTIQSPGKGRAIQRFPRTKEAKQQSQEYDLVDLVHGLVVLWRHHSTVTR